MKNNIIVIDLRQFTEKTKTLGLVEISNYLKSIKIPTNIKNLAYDLYCAKEGIQCWGKPFQRSKPWFKVWLCKDSLEIIAFENKEGNSFTQNFLHSFASISPVESGDSPYSKNHDYIPYGHEEYICQTLDEVLDKISESGIDSLCDEELQILNNTN